MTVAVYILGAILVIAGAVSISMGVPIVRLEIGWSEIIGGAVAGSAGFVILAIGVILTRLDALQRTLIGHAMAATIGRALAEPDAAWEQEEPVRALAPHPLAPSPSEPEAERYGALAEPEVEPEAPLQAAPLHADAEPAVAVPLRHPLAPVAEPESERDQGAAALLASDDHAPDEPAEPQAPPVTLGEEPPAVPASPPPLVPLPPDLSRNRPNFLAAFLARRNAAAAGGAERPSFRDSGPVLEPPLVPHSEPEERPTPGRTSIDLSSGWDAPEPAAADHGAHHADDDLHRPEPENPHAAEPVAEEDHHHAEAAAGDAHDKAAAGYYHDEPLRGAHHDDHEAAYADEPDDPAPEPDPQRPVVVGRYNAGSASYVMYSNGMIEVETDSGTHQFASMQELKAFIERRDAASV